MTFRAGELDKKFGTPNIGQSFISGTPRAVIATWAELSVASGDWVISNSLKIPKGSVITEVDVVLNSTAEFDFYLFEDVYNFQPSKGDWIGNGINGVAGSNIVPLPCTAALNDSKYFNAPLDKDYFVVFKVQTAKTNFAIKAFVSFVQL